MVAGNGTEPSGFEHRPCGHRAGPACHGVVDVGRVRRASAELALHTTVRLFMPTYDAVVPDRLRGEGAAICSHADLLAAASPVESSRAFEKEMARRHGPRAYCHPIIGWCNADRSEKTEGTMDELSGPNPAAARPDANPQADRDRLARRPRAPGTPTRTDTMKWMTAAIAAIVTTACAVVTPENARGPEGQGASEEPGSAAATTGASQVGRQTFALAIDSPCQKSLRG
jgi:hypothetical protein